MIYNHTAFISNCFISSSLSLIATRVLKMLFTEKSVTIYTEHSCSVMKRSWKRHYLFYFHITYLCILYILRIIHLCDANKFTTKCVTLMIKHPIIIQHIRHMLDNIWRLYSWYTYSWNEWYWLLNWHSYSNKHNRIKHKFSVFNKRRT